MMVWSVRREQRKRNPSIDTAEIGLAEVDLPHDEQTLLLERSRAPPWPREVLPSFIHHFSPQELGLQTSLLGG